MNLTRSEHYFFVPTQMIKMSDKLIDLMEMMLAYHERYEGDYRSFNDRVNFELSYWYNLKQLNILIEAEFKTIKPFTNKDY